MAVPMPKRIRIGFQTYKVKSSKSHDETLKDAGQAGASNGDHALIRVRADLPHLSRAETLLHEILHQVLFVAGQNNDETVEEAIVRAMSMGLMQTLRDNPELVAFLLNQE